MKYSEKRFQFHKGTIKRGEEVYFQTRPGTFQFHKGTIKSKVLEIINRPENSFNSIKVRLKEKDKAGKDSERIVSIP